MTDRPDCIRHYSEIQDPDNSHYPDSDELMSIGSPFARRMGLTRLGIHHELLKPGRRTSFPHAESAEEEFAYVIEGHPDVWLDGVLYPLGPGDAVSFPAGTGQAHTFLNNSDRDARLLVVGEASKAENRIRYPLNPETEARRKDVWTDLPARPLGPHDGMPHAGTRAVAAGPIDRIDHFVLTVADVGATCAFYVATLGVTVVKGPGTRRAIQFGRNKINLHAHGREWSPRALHPTPGAGDFCLISGVPLQTIQARLAAAGVPIELGPVERPGALGSMQSIYFRDPDQNLVEVSCYPPGLG
ncbi:MAG TPA: cupin domain-containing protein [Aliidongia sp.]|uniref:cupin domain-containing protein n=1 Tax=Aliidongia sp. TaxID=1914230 RepID=UPI002DDD0BBE|nr:cupin domain-containing protein [Aliidongia sp.]HEV2677127.1 cupin domain-containing protein [Aliidongia sp.]